MTPRTVTENRSDVQEVLMHRNAWMQRGACVSSITTLYGEHTASGDSLVARGFEVDDYRISKTAVALNAVRHFGKSLGCEPGGLMGALACV